MVVLITEPDDLLSVRWEKLGEKPKTGSAFGISLGETETEALASAKKSAHSSGGADKSSAHLGRFLAPLIRASLHWKRLP
jgi:hypothetical protein